MAVRYYWFWGLCREAGHVGLLLIWCSVGARSVGARFVLGLCSAVRLVRRLARLVLGWLGFVLLLEEVKFELYFECFVGLDSGDLGWE